MKVNAKKIAAAMAAVDVFLESENQLVAQQPVKPEQQKSGWASYGRQQIMNDRAFLQSRLYK